MLPNLIRPYTRYSPWFLAFNHSKHLIKLSYCHSYYNDVTFLTNNRISTDTCETMGRGCSLSWDASWNLRQPGAGERVIRHRTHWLSFWKLHHHMTVFVQGGSSAGLHGQEGQRIHRFLRCLQRPHHPCSLQGWSTLLSQLVIFW